MKVFFKPLKADGEYGESMRLEDIADNKAYEIAANVYPTDPAYVEEMLDGRGYIFIQTNSGMFTYQQDSL